MIRYALALALIATPAYAKPAKVTVVEVIDGDTFIIEGEWAIIKGRKLLFRVPGTVKVRVLGIDTPEKGHLAKCAEEAAHSKKAVVYANALLAKGAVTIAGMQHDKYGGRLDAEPSIDKVQFTEAMVEAGFALPYTGEGPKPDWCAILKGAK
jgi:endonuclease YncB( thermonuclease family)